MEGWRIDDCRGLRVGTLERVYRDADGVVAWFLVRLGRYSTRFVLTPPADTLSWAGRVSLPWDRVRIERAPLLYAPPTVVSPALTADLRRHYGLDPAPGADLTVRRTVA